MHEYRVVERWGDKDLCALQCDKGHYHVVRALNGKPPAGIPLNGADPQLGFGILVGIGSNSIFRVIFESVDVAELAPVQVRTPSRTPAAMLSMQASAGGDD
jgi:hypothetical protein